MDTGLKDKIAIVTGAAKGVGRAIALKLAEESAKVIVADIDETESMAVVDGIAKLGSEAIAVKTDVSKNDDVVAMVNEAIRKFGRVDVLVNNAGVVGPQGPWSELSEEAFDLVVGINFKGVFLCSKAVIPHMMKQEGGKIVHIASCAAKTGEEFNGVYSATKGAVRNMTQSMATELGRHNINVNAVCPAAMDTDLMEKVYRERSRYFGIDADDLKKQIKSSFRLPGDLTVDDAANLAVFLASAQAGMITGQAVNVTAGIETH